MLALSELHPAHEAALLADPARGAVSAPGPPAATNADGMLSGAASRWPTSSGRRRSSRPCGDRHRLPPRRRPRSRVVLAHTNPPTTRRGLRGWEPSMIAIHERRTSPGPPTVIVADLNAPAGTRPFVGCSRRGWRDAHESVGPWPQRVVADDRAWPVPFVRLDHAWSRDDIDVAAVDDFAVPGSDHRALRARRSRVRDRRSQSAARRTPGRDGRSRSSPLRTSR